MLNANRAERILSRGTIPERAAAIVGDLAEEARTRGTLWFWFHVFRTALSQMRLSEEQRLSLIFGLIGGGMWMGLLILGNLGGTAVLGNIRDNHPRVYGATRYFALGGLLVPVMTGLSAAYRMGGSMRAALRAGLLSGFISRCDVPADHRADDDRLSRCDDARSFQYPGNLPGEQDGSPARRSCRIFSTGMRWAGD